MSMSTLKAPVMNNIAKRCYANKSSAAAAAASLSVRGPQVQTKKLANGTLVVAVPDYPTNVGRVSVTFLAGSRYEDPEIAGISHLVRSSAGLSTESSSTFSIVRNLGHLGANFYATSDRETISYTLEAHKDNIVAGLKYYIDSIVGQTFKPWELSDNSKRVEYELLTVPPAQRALDLAHKAAYRRALGNTVYLPKYNAKKLGTEHLLHYVKNNFRAPNAVVSGVGVDVDTLVHVSEDLNLPGDASAGRTPKSKYFGGDLRKSKPLDATYLAVVGEGASYGDKHSASFAVLQYLLGTGSSVKWGQGQGVLEQSVLKSNCPVDGNFAVTAVNYNYSDSGLFGFLLAYNGKDVGDVLKAAVHGLRSPTVNDTEVNRAKRQLILSLVSTSESGAGVHENITYQAATTGQVIPFEKLIAAVEAVTVEDVKKAAAKIAGGKLSLAGYGNVATTPYLDDL